MIDQAFLIEDLTEGERAKFEGEFISRCKSVTVGVRLAIFLGGLGAHRFYLRQTGIALLYILFSVTIVPVVVAVVESFLMPGRVRRYNSEVTRQIVLEIKAHRSG